MSLAQLGALIWSGRWRVLVCLVASLAGALVLSYRLPKTYEAKARVILEVMRPDPVTGVSYNNKTTDQYVETQRILVNSDRVMGSVIDKLGWANNPAVIDSWQQQTGGVGDVRSWAAGRLAREVAAYPLEGGGIMEIAYRAGDPEAAQTIVRAIREAYIETALALQNEAAQRRAKRFEELLVPARTSFAAAQAQLIAVQRETGTVLGPLGADIREGNLSRLEAQSITADFSAEQASNRAGQESRSLELSQLRGQLIKLEQQLSSADNTLGANNPNFQALTEQRALLVGQIARAQAALRAQNGATAAAGRRMQQQDDASYQAERERLLANLPVNIRVVQAQRMVALRGGEVQRLQANLASARQMADRTESGLVVMGDVIGSNEPVAPDIPLNGLLAAGFGLAIGLASVMIDGLWRREVLHPTDLAGATGVPVLAVLKARRRPWLRWRRRATA